MFSKKLGIIGIGNMGSAFLNGLISSKMMEPDDILIHDVDKEALKERNEFDVEVANDNIDLVKNARYILIAVKPQVIDDVLTEIAPSVTEDQALISVAAGVTLKHLETFISNGVGIVRVMPNTPALVGAGASVMAINDFISEEDKEFVKKILNSIGIAFELDEKHLDAVTGLSGSGPAYIFLIIEGLADGGVKMGLPRAVALKLAAQTVMGAAKMLLETDKHPGILKDMITSPGGTTIDAIHELEKRSLRGTMMSAVEKATEKSRSLK